MYSTTGGSLRVFDLDKDKIVMGTEIGPKKIASKLLWSNDGSYIITGQAQTEEVKVWDAKNLTVLKKLPDVDWPHSLFETKSHLLVCCDNKRQLSVWDMKDWHQRKMSIPVLASSTIGQPGKPNIVLVNDFGGEKDNKMLLVDVDSMKIVREMDVSTDYPTYAFSPDGSKIYKSNEDKVEVFDADSLKKLTDIAGMSPTAYRCSSDEDNKYFISSDREGVHAWNIINGQKVHDWNDQLQHFIKLPGSEHSFIGVKTSKSEGKSEIKGYNTRSLSDTVFLSLNSDVEYISADSDHLGIAVKEFLSPEEAPDSELIRIYNITNFNASPYAFTIKGFNTQPLEYGVLYGAGIAAFDFSIRDNMAAVVTWWQDGFGHGKYISNHIRFYDIRTGAELMNWRVRLANSIGKLKFSATNDSIIEARTEKGSYSINFISRRIVSQTQFKLEETVYKIDDSIDLSVSKSYIRKLKGGKDIDLRFIEFDNLVGSQAFPKSNLLVTLSSSNEISFYSIDNLNKCLSIIPKFNNEWITYSPAGYFVSSPKGGEKVYWSLGDRQLEFNSLSYKFRKPNLITETLDSIINQRETTPYGLVTNNNFSRYKVTLLPASDIKSTFSKKYQLNVSIQKPNKDIEDPQITLRLKGNSKKFNLRAVNATDYLLTANLVLTDEDSNNIEIILNNQFIALEHSVYYSARGVPEQNLCFFGVGIGAFSDTNKLYFSRKDILDVSRLLKSQEKIRYSNVDIDTLFDGNASRDNIEHHIDSIVNNIDESTILIVYISGHGAEANNHLYLMGLTSNWALPYEQNMSLNYMLDTYLRKRLNQNISKTFLWLDMCNSGVIENAANAGWTSPFNYTYANSLSAFTASTAGKKAKESSAFGNGGNGAFTAAMLEGMGCSADMLPANNKFANGNNDKSVDVTELYNYVSKRVKDLTGSQMPEKAIQLGVLDCIITKCQ